MLLFLFTDERRLTQINKSEWICVNLRSSVDDISSFYFWFTDKKNMPENLTFRRATINDLPKIVEMLADDFLGAERERFQIPLPADYVLAFEEIDADDNNDLIVVEQNGETVGTMQITFIPSISFQGGRRAQIESVRVVGEKRGQGIGKKMFEWAIRRARAKSCRMIQLSTNNDRADAQRFYENLGFKASHVGMKLYL